MGLYLIATQSMWLDPQLWVSVFKAMFGLGFVIFVHELGHFLVAKMCGVKCEKFYVGFDVPIKIGPLKLPAALFRKQWGETEYGIGIIPLGGYVKMLGQDGNPARGRHSLQLEMNKSLYLDSNNEKIEKKFNKLKSDLENLVGEMRDSLTTHITPMAADE